MISAACRRRASPRRLEAASNAAVPRHVATEISSYAPERLFDLVADIESYPKFLPWCTGARAHPAPDDAAALLADLKIGFGALTMTYASRVRLDRPGLRIDVEAIDGPFRFLRNRWRFRAADNGCEITFDLAFEVRSRMMAMVIEPFFLEATRRMARAFRERADALYGTPVPALTPG